MQDDDPEIQGGAAAATDTGPHAAGAEPDLPVELRNRLPARDPEALAAFFDLYFDRIYGYVRRLVRDEHLAEDLTQDIFVHIHRAFASYDPARKLRPWVFTIATNKLRDHWRSRRHRDSQNEISAEHEGTLESLSDERVKPEGRMAAEELDGRLRQAVDELPAGMRITVLLRVWEGLSFEDIGKMIDRNEVAVRKRYSRALETLRQSLGNDFRLELED